MRGNLLELLDKNMFKSVKGMKDKWEGQEPSWFVLKEKLVHHYQTRNFKEITTPVLESFDLFVRGVGEASDIVQKELYHFEDQGDKHLCLRPEGTAAVVRAVLENQWHQQNKPLKLFYYLPMFRRERPQKGRFRQHHQWGLEIMGTPSYKADREVIATQAELLDSLGINYQLQINSVGCASCRKEYYKKLKEDIESKGLCETCGDRKGKNPLRVFDCKNLECQKQLETSPRVTDFLCVECGTHFDNLQKELEVFGISYEVSHKVVRGLDYYEKTAFEFLSQDLGAQNTLCGGGRYDPLFSILGGNSYYGVGSGMGM